MTNEELFEKLRAVLRKKKYKMPNRSPYKGTAGAAVYLEHVLGLSTGKHDLLPAADAWEIKTVSPRTQNVTLFLKAPGPEGVMHDVIRTWGRQDDNGRPSFKQTIGGRTRTLRVSAAPNKILLRAVGGDSPLAPYWTHDALTHAVGGRLRRLLLVQIKRTGQAVTFVQAECFEGFRTEALFSEIVRGTVAIDFDAHISDAGDLRDRGTKFLIGVDDLCRLYNSKRRFG